MAVKETGRNQIGKGKPGPGRPKGSVNKTTALLKDAILKAAENAGNKVGSDGMVSYLEDQARENPTAFMGLLGKVLPHQVEGPNKDGSMTFRIATGVPRGDD